MNEREARACIYTWMSCHMHLSYQGFHGLFLLEAGVAPRQSVQHDAIASLCLSHMQACEGSSSLP